MCEGVLLKKKKVLGGLAEGRQWVSRETLLTVIDFASVGYADRDPERRFITNARIRVNKFDWRSHITKVKTKHNARVPRDHCN
jgi:hypothetical protein